MINAFVFDRLPMGGGFFVAIWIIISTFVPQIIRNNDRQKSYTTE